VCCVGVRCVYICVACGVSMCCGMCGVVYLGGVPCMCMW